jgi:nucleoside-diphosphate-sugar epimerase
VVSRAVLSGATGHLGGEIARQLVAAGAEVHGLTRQAERVRASSVGGMRLHYVDGSTENLVAILSEVKPDVVMHVASMYRREHRADEISALVSANVLFGTQLLEAMRAAGCLRMVTAGSFFQHFHSDEYRALNLYAATKQAFEDILAYYVDAFGFSAAVLTLYEIYSENDIRRKLMTAAADALKKSAPLDLPEQEFWMDFVHVEDAAAAFLRVADVLAKDKTGLLRYSVCSGDDVSGSELAALFEKIGGRELQTRRGAFAQPARAMPRPWRGPVVPGWVPRVTLEQGIARMLNQQE